MWKGPLKTSFCQESEQQVCLSPTSGAEFHFPRRWRGEYRGLVSFLLLFATLSSPTLQEEGAPQTRACLGVYRIRGAPKPEHALGPARIGGPQTRACLGAPKGANPPLLSLNTYLSTPSITKQPVQAMTASLSFSIIVIKQLLGKSRLSLTFILS